MNGAWSPMADGNPEPDPEVSLAGSGSRPAGRAMDSEEGVWDGMGYMRAKKRKLREQFKDIDQEKTSDIFSGVTIYVNGWTDPNADELKRLIHAHGGHYEYNLYGDSKVTHTIATNLPNAKVKNLGDSCVCTPDWIVDSVAAGKRLPVQDYLLYSKHAASQKQLKFEKRASEQECRAPAGGQALLDASEAEQSLPMNSNQDERAGFATAETAVEQRPPRPTHEATLESLIPKAKPTKSRSYNPTKGAEFVSEFYTHSRLHHLSTWSTELKQFTSKTLPQATQKQPKLPPERSLRGQNRRLMAHIDLDCFFVSVSIRDKPHLRGRPVAVCHAKLPKGKEHQREKQSPSGHSDTSAETTSQDGASLSLRESSALPQYLLKSMSDIASCSYEARSAGLYNGMFVGEALRLCPELQLVPYEFDKYHEVSKEFYKILMSYSAAVEAVSCDEAYIELTDYVQSIEQAEKVIQEVRDEVQSSTGCTVSAGLAGNMLLARMATRVAKPNGQYFLPMDEVMNFLTHQKVHDLPGVGYSTSLKLREMGVETCGELQQVSLSKLQSEFGTKTGRMLHESSHGKDSRELKLSAERKSLSVDLNYGIRLATSSDAEDLLKNISEELERRATEAQVLGGTITLKLMIRKPEAPSDTRKYLGHGSCNTASRSCSLLQPTGEAAEISRMATRLLKQISPSPQDIRGVGLQLTRLVSSQETSGGGRTSTTDLRRLLPAKPQLIASSATPTDLPPLPNLNPSASNSTLPQPPPSAPNLDDTFNIDLPPASQLDNSVLEALPLALREKIQSGYAKLDQIASLPSWDMIGNGADPAAVLQRSPARPGRSPNSKGGVKRGRGRGGGGGRGRGSGSPQGSRRRQGIRTNGALNTSPGKQKRLTDLTDTTTSMQETILPQSKMELEAPLPESEAVESNKIVIEDLDHFLSELRAYLKDWVHGSLSGPLDSDLAKVTTYFTQLCEDNLEAVFVVLQGFRRLLVNLGIPEWFTAFNSLLATVQNCIRVNYSGTLPVENIDHS